MKTTLILAWIAWSICAITALFFTGNKRDPQSEKYSILETRIEGRNLDIRMRKATKEEIEENRKAIENERLAEQ